MSLLYYTCAIVLELDTQRCTGCGRCVEVCPHDVFALERKAGSAAERTRRTAVIVRRERCMECGACARNCAPGAIKANSGVGCAAAIINGMIKGTAPTCGCGDDPSSGCSCSGS